MPHQGPCTVLSPVLLSTMSCAGVSTGAGAGAGGSMLLERWTLCFSPGVNSSSTSRAPMDTAAVYKRLVRVDYVQVILMGSTFGHCHGVLPVLSTASNSYYSMHTASSCQELLNSSVLRWCRTAKAAAPTLSCGIASATRHTRLPCLVLQSFSYKLVASSMPQAVCFAPHTLLLVSIHANELSQLFCTCRSCCCGHCTAMCACCQRTACTVPANGTEESCSTPATRSAQQQTLPCSPCSTGRNSSNTTWQAQQGAWPAAATAAACASLPSPQSRRWEGRSAYTWSTSRQPPCTSWRCESVCAAVCF